MIKNPRAIRNKLLPFPNTKFVWLPEMMSKMQRKLRNKISRKRDKASQLPINGFVGYFLKFA
jgi:hypothetical protein